MTPSYNLGDTLKRRNSHIELSQGSLDWVTHSQLPASEPFSQSLPRTWQVNDYPPLAWEAPSTPNMTAFGYAPHTPALSPQVYFDFFTHMSQPNNYIATQSQSMTAAMPMADGQGFEPIITQSQLQSIPMSAASPTLLLGSMETMSIGSPSNQLAFPPLQFGLEYPVHQASGSDIELSTIKQERGYSPQALPLHSPILQGYSFPTLSTEVPLVGQDHPTKTEPQQRQTHSPWALDAHSHVDQAEAQVHTKYYSCPMPNCSKTFTRASNRKTHIQTHSSEKNFACKTCKRSFARVHDMNRHARCHTQDLPYVCIFCKKAFVRNDPLWRHYKRDHGDHPCVPKPRPRNAPMVIKGNKTTLPQ